MTINLLRRLLYIVAMTATVAFQSRASAVDFNAMVDIFGLAGTLQSSVCADCVNIAFKVDTYANGNSDARIDGNVVDKSILIPIKTTMISTEYIQLLIMIRILKNEGAQNIRLLAPSSKKIKVLGDGSEEFELNHRLNFAAAGATELIGDGSLKVSNLQRYLKTQRSRLGKVRATGPAVIDTNVHPELGASLSENLAIPVLNRSIPDTKDNSIFLIYSQVEPVNDTLLQTLAKAHRYFKQHNDVHLISPYMPYARGDKADKPGVTATLALIADLFIESGVSSVHFVRPHAAQGRLAYSRIIVHETSSYDTIAKAITDEKVDLIISPDAGAQKEATVFADRITDGEVAVINKQRKGNKIEIRGISISDAFISETGEVSLEGKTVLILDDESASGSTLAEAADLLKTKYKATRVIAAFTHLTGDAAKAIKSPYLDRIVVTNTIPVKITNSRMSVISIADELSRLVQPLVESRIKCQASINGGNK